MCAVFLKKSSKRTYYDGITMPDGYSGRTISATITVEDGKATKSIYGGRITEFILHEEDGELLSLYKDGEWKKKLNPDDDVALLAQQTFLAGYSSATLAGLYGAEEMDMPESH